MTPMAALFGFTIRQTLLSRRIWLTLLLLAGPSALIVLVRAFAPAMTTADKLWEQYHGSLQFLLIPIILPLVCLVHGTGLIGSEVEGKTLVYLITRRMRRATVLLVKFVATGLVLAVLCDVAVLGVHVSTFAGQDVSALASHAPTYASWKPGHDLLCYLAVIPAGVAGFLAVFTLIGLLTRQALGLSVFYLIVVELIVGNVPAGVRANTLLHTLRETLAGAIPRLARIFPDLPPDLRERLYPAGGTGLPALAIVVFVALALAGLLVSRRELMPSKIARE
jgi:ABC-2 type transport system permease protein